MMNHALILGVGVVLLMTTAASHVAGALAASDEPKGRLPAVPLVTHDPYFSAWSTTDKLTESWPKHWTGATNGMCGLARIDGKPFRWCGTLPENATAMQQKSISVDQTSTTYLFEAGGLSLSIEFGSPIGVSGDMVQASRPVSYVRATAASTDGKEHEVQVYLDVSGEWVVNSADQRVNWSRVRLDGIDAVSIGTQEQPVLAKSGDNLRIDWGRMYLTAGNAANQASVKHDVSVAADHVSRGGFIADGKLPESDDTRMPRAVNDNWPVMAGLLSLGKVNQAGVSGHFLLAYDDGLGIELFERRLKPLWAAKGEGIGAMISQVSKAMSGADAEKSDAAKVKFTQEATAVGGEKYAALVNLAYRQVMAGHKIVADWDGSPLMFSKENSSNGCIATIDVIYPACPFFLYHSPEMLKPQLKPLLQYSSSARWTFPFAPHDLGTYPKANGQVYGGGERTETDQMPVEESGNMLIMLGALAKVEGNSEFSKPYFAVLEKWAEYLKVNGLDPANQLCTDDFAGHLARNANLSAKTVVALAAYAELLRIDGQNEKASMWKGVAQDYAKRWMTLAAASGGAGGTVLVFDKPETWSQKYNLIWDRVLGLGLFPQSVFDQEAKIYQSKMQRYGLPLDSRKTYTKLDWMVWSACLTGKRSDFDAVMGPVYTWVNETPSRVVLSDWYETTDGKAMGFHARTVVGGMWMPLLMKKMGNGLK